MICFEFFETLKHSLKYSTHFATSKTHPIQMVPTARRFHSETISPSSRFSATRSENSVPFQTIAIAIVTTGEGRGMLGVNSARMQAKKIKHTQRRTNGIHKNWNEQNRVLISRLTKQCWPPAGFFVWSNTIIERKVLPKGMKQQQQLWNWFSGWWCGIPVFVRIGSTIFRKPFDDVLIAFGLQELSKFSICCTDAPF